MSEDLRRVDDQRYIDLTKKVDRVASDVQSIRDMLISEPEASPLGRALLKYAADNRALIMDSRREFEDFKDKEFEPVHDWWLKSRGGWQFFQGLAVVLGVVATFFALLAYFGIRATP